VDFLPSTRSRIYGKVDHGQVRNQATHL
jgi:hypothetical protein